MVERIEQKIFGLHRKWRRGGKEAEVAAECRELVEDVELEKRGRWSVFRLEFPGGVALELWFGGNNVLDAVQWYVHGRTYSPPVAVSRWFNEWYASVLEWFLDVVRPFREINWVES